ncbi:MAG: ATP-grasp domain-containing protein [Acidobacteriota bacterium]
MFILDEPFVSDVLRDSVIASGASVLETPMAAQVLAGSDVRLSSDAEFVSSFRECSDARIYTCSEASIEWVAEHLADTELPGRIAVLKDKLRFRRLLQERYPETFFRGVRFSELRDVDPEALPSPFVVKPAVGFFSLGVHVVESAAAWPDTLATIERDVAKIRGIYPDQVVNSDRFLIEECLEGDEYAIDAYYDAEGQPVIVNIMAHPFASGRDVSDRVYFTSRQLIERWHAPFTEFLRDIGSLAGLASFPTHTEVRVDGAGRIVPIEVNPLRFGGWCAVDIAHYAYGFDPYLSYLHDQPPDWERILSSDACRACALVVADLPARLDRSTIRSVDTERFLAGFSKPIDLRRIDPKRYPVFAFLFTEFEEGDFSELDAVLGADLTEYLRF